jgi:cyclophilin family peptidyl-prolyl cis-trans isomerase
VRCEIDRARRFQSGTSLGTVVVGLEANRSRFFFVFCLFSVIFGFLKTKVVVWGKVTSGMNRARRVLSGTSVGTVEVGLKTNRSRFFFVFCLFPVVFWFLKTKGGWYGGK